MEKNKDRSSSTSAMIEEFDRHESVSPTGRSQGQGSRMMKPQRMAFDVLKGFQYEAIGCQKHG